MDINGLTLQFATVSGPAAATTRNVPLVPAGTGLTNSPNQFVNSAGIISGLSEYNSLDIVHSVAVQGVGGTSYDIYLQGSYDGTLWFDVAHLPQIVIADAVGIISHAHISSYGAGAPVAKGAPNSLAAATVRACAIPPLLRVSEVSVGTFSPVFQYNLSLYARP